MKILVIDIGNTSTSLGVYSNKGITKSLKVLNPNDKKIMNDGINHKILLSNNILIVEYLTSLKKIKKKNFLFCGAPLNINSSDGSPLRAIGMY